MLAMARGLSIHPRPCWWRRNRRKHARRVDERRTHRQTEPGLPSALALPKKAPSQVPVPVTPPSVTVVVSPAVPPKDALPAARSTLFSVTLHPSSDLSLPMSLNSVTLPRMLNWSFTAISSPPKFAVSKAVAVNTPAAPPLSTPPVKSFVTY